VPQDQINQQLVDLAKQGKRVRLKGGDPFIFGRGGEEIEELAAHGIPFQVVPGITAASGCAAYAGIPLTHRDYAQSVRFVTGHLERRHHQPALGRPGRPGADAGVLHGPGWLADDLRAVDCPRSPADTPAALIQQGTTVNQRVFTGTLADLPPGGGA
jgi:uroporphyrin-III C-methyltransferase/precorrin-2 dehydrogenase/sirohydrochlorin ferrochelatase